MTRKPALCTTTVTVAPFASMDFVVARQGTEWGQTRRSAWNDEVRNNAAVTAARFGVNIASNTRSPNKVIIVKRYLKARFNIAIAYA